MSFITGSIPGSITTGDVSATIDPDTAATLTIGGDRTTANFAIPAGAYRVKITNAGLAGSGAEATASINFIDLFPGDTKEWKAVRDTVSGELKTLPAINVTTNGAEIWYEFER